MDGSRWFVAAGNEPAAPVVRQFADAMQLLVAPVEPPIGGDLSNLPIVRHLTVLADDRNSDSPPAAFEPLPTQTNGHVVCTLPATRDQDELFIDFLRLSLIIARDVQERGGILLHAALAERDGRGVLLAAPGGTGKTTASQRLPPPWHSLCDDTTLIVRDIHNTYWAHAWPTWSRFLSGGPCGSWNVQSAVPLERIFFLSQSEQDRVEPLGPGHAASMLTESAQQIGHVMTRGMNAESARTIHMQRFENACALARAIPAHSLHLSLTGRFWHEMEQVMTGRDDGS